MIPSLYHLQRLPPPTVPQATQDESGPQTRSSGFQWNFLIPTSSVVSDPSFSGCPTTENCNRYRTRSPRPSPRRTTAFFLNAVFDFPLIISSVPTLLLHLTLLLLIKQHTSRLPCYASPHHFAAASPAWLIDARHAKTCCRAPHGNLLFAIHASHVLTDQQHKFNIPNNVCCA